jgi:hypothetical protein
MIRLRLTPSVPQVRLWDISDLEGFDPRPIFRRGHPWMGADHPFEFMHRARLWRHLTDDHGYDLSGYLGRLAAGFDADRADPRYRVPALDAIPQPSAVPPPRAGSAEN